MQHALYLDLCERKNIVYSGLLTLSNGIVQCKNFAVCAFHAYDEYIVLRHELMGASEHALRTVKIRIDK